jgi:hypothetical protein
MGNDCIGPAFTNCIFTGNRADQDGGGVGASPTFTFGMSFVRVTFLRNEATTGSAQCCPLYPFLSPAVVAVFNCREVAGVWYFEADYSIVCYDS